MVRMVKGKERGNAPGDDEGAAVIRYVRSKPLHCWLRRTAIGLMLLMPFDIAFVIATGMQTPIVNTHIVATFSLLILAKLDRLEQARRDSARSTRDLTEAAAGRR